MLPLIFLMSGARIYWRIRVVMGKFSRGKGEVSILKVKFSSYFALSPSIQLTRLGALMDWTKFEGFSKFMVYKTS